MKIKKFEDIVAWQKARELIKLIYEITSNQMFTKDFALKEQLRRSAISVLSNISEGFERGTNKELIQYLTIARGSAGELKSQIYISRDIGYINKDTYENIIFKISEVLKLINSFRNYLLKSQNSSLY